MRRDGIGRARPRRGLAWLAGIALAALVGVTLGLGPRDGRAQTGVDVPAADTGAAGTPPGEAAAATLGPVTKLPLPRYVSLRSNKINVRRGPGQIYRIDWVFRRAGLPVRIVDEYRDWRRIVDSDDAGGWVFHSLLSGRRTVLITAPIAELHDEPTLASPVAARAEQGVVASLIECEPDWCEIETGEISGWVRKEAIWGVDPGETLPD
ncbi:SH3 domain-containing protein [Limibaculum sp. FT325]|uniref:SH3 domain-containing protein n=1 Tax=Thermohalobaculum sediminis TaxID=2939436 RepID=UPI0020C0E675|nr:SH3 domain-containing protein [Limibaculum sediminis]MCL5777591.1 SH3 domain-containing protein [Limibaculum sediminis]